MISVHFVSSADGIDVISRIAHSVFHVVPDDTDTVAEDVVVDLIDGAVNGLGFGVGLGGNIGAIRDEVIGTGLGSFSQGGADR